MEFYLALFVNIIMLGIIILLAKKSLVWFKRKRIEAKSDKTPEVLRYTKCALPFTCVFVTASFTVIYTLQLIMLLIFWVQSQTIQL